MRPNPGDTRRPMAGGWIKGRMPLLLLLWMVAMVPWPGEAAPTAEIELQVTDTTADRLVFCRPMAAGDRFKLRYRHSVEKTPVEEVYEVTADGTIFLVETTVRSSGYGLPECAPGQDCIVDDGKVIFRRLHLRIDDLVMRVSYLNDMWLLFENAKLNLRQAAPGGHRIAVRACPTR